MANNYGNVDLIAALRAGVTLTLIELYTLLKEQMMTCDRHELYLIYWNLHHALGRDPRYVTHGWEHDDVLERFQDCISLQPMQPCECIMESELDELLEEYGTPSAWTPSDVQDRRTSLRELWGCADEVRRYQHLGTRTVSSNKSLRILSMAVRLLESPSDVGLFYPLHGIRQAMDDILKNIPPHHHVGLTLENNTGGRETLFELELRDQVDFLKVRNTLDTIVKSNKEFFIDGVVTFTLWHVKKTKSNAKKSNPKKSSPRKSDPKKPSPKKCNLKNLNPKKG